MPGDCRLVRVVGHLLTACSQVLLCCGEKQEALISLFDSSVRKEFFLSLSLTACVHPEKKESWRQIHFLRWHL